MNGENLAMIRNLKTMAEDKSRRWEYKFCDDSSDYQDSTSTDSNEDHHRLEDVTEKRALLQSNFSSQSCISEVSFIFDLFIIPEILSKEIWMDEKT
uniref:Uncharacterized protein n=1 Tax=Onchocerca volvulus TaxID=6282 RepID=A0A2K6VIN8_ONCVO